MKLEVGKKYRRRDGTGPVEIIYNKKYGSYMFGKTANDARYYTPEGRWSGREHTADADESDLVAEWEKPEAQEVVEKKFTTLSIEAANGGGYFVASYNPDKAILSKPFTAAFTTLQEATAFIAKHLSAEGK